MRLKTYAALAVLLAAVLCIELLSPAAYADPGEEVPESSPVAGVAGIADFSFESLGDTDEADPQDGESPETEPDTAEEPDTAVDPAELLHFASSIDTSYLADARITPVVTAAKLREEQEEESRMNAEELERRLKSYQDIGEIGIVKTSLSLNIRKEPSEDAPVIGKLYQGSGIVYGGQTGTWTYVTSGGISGWAASRFILMNESAVSFAGGMNPRVATVVAEELAVRKEADGESELLALIKHGAHYPVEDVEGDWVRLQITSQDEGYVNAEYVIVEEGLCEAVDRQVDEDLQVSIDQIEADRVAAREAAEEAARKAEESKKKESGGSGSSKKDPGGSGSSKKKDPENPGSNNSGWTTVGTCRISSYCPDCNSPSGYDTYTGRDKAEAGRTVAVDPDVIPLGATVKIEGLGTFKANDIGVSGKWVDVFVGGSGECHIWTKATVSYKK